MLNYFITKNENECSGCGACVSKCPHSAISLQKNNEGFLYPEINKALCTDCGLCNKVCPFENPPTKAAPLDICLVQHLNEEILSKSSSGGVFRLLADYVLKQDGYVCGCILNDKHEAVLTLTQESDIIEKMMGSKYVYSKACDVYASVKQKLDQNHPVLFTGSPCQCAAIIKFLGKPYENLITAEFLCHGMPSQTAFEYYLKSKTSDLSSISNIQFRDKSKKGWGLVVSFIKGKKKHYSVENTDSYLFAFIRGYLNRYACYECPFTGEERYTDFTFADFWGVEKYHSDIKKEKGVSAVSVNTVKAQKIKQTLENSAIWQETKREYVAFGNPAILEKHSGKAPAIRKNIYETIKNNGWKYCEKRFFRPHHYIIKKIWYRLPRKLTNKIKALVRR